MHYPEIESDTVELKRELPHKNKIINTAIGFCNSRGGKIVLGVADDRSIVGLNEQTIEEVMESVDQSIYDACAPHIVPRVYAQRFGDKFLVIIEISEGMNKPYYRRAEGVEKSTYIRLGRHTLRANETIVQELRWQSRGIDFERLPVYESTTEDLNEKKIKEFLTHRKNHATTHVDQATLQSYNIITFEQSKIYPTNLGILLFGNNPQQFFSESMIICSHFKGTSGREAIASIDCTGDLFSQFKQAFAFVIDHLYRSFEIKTIKRTEQLEIPEVAIREALLNMVVHRNYHIKAPSKIAIYNDRVEFFSPGNSPGLIMIENLKSGISYLRNPAICKIFREANYIEKLGSGFITIFESYEKHGLKTPQVIEGENFVKCVLPREEKITAATSLHTISLDMLFNNKSDITIKDVIQHHSISRSTALRILNDMLKNGLIERIGEKRATRYRKKT